MIHRWTPAIVFTLVLAGCSSKDDPASPDPTPVAPTIEEFFVSTGGSVRHGNTARLIWTAPNAEAAAISPGIGSVAPASDGSVTIRPALTTTYTLTVTNSVGSASATITVDVEYLPGLYVDGTNGDDARTGVDPQNALETLDEALSRIGGGGSIFITGSTDPAFGTYVTAIELDARDVSIYGGRDPATFFTDPEEFPTRIRPASGSPLVVRNTATMLQFFDLAFDAANGGAHAALVADAGAMFERCRFDAGNCATGTAIQLEGNARVNVNSSQVRGGRDRLYLETAGIRASSSSDLQVTNTFVDGGRANNQCSGIEARGAVRLGFNTILVEVVTQGVGRNAAGVRIVDGTVSIGGNILLGQGTGQRVGVLEGSDGVNPAWMEGNLFVALSVPPYLNADDDSPTTEEQLNDARFTTNNAATVGGNFWAQSVNPFVMFVNVNGGDFHLVDPMPGGADNPAVNRGDTFVVKPQYGSVSHDIDGERRPQIGSQFDLGADEL